MNKIHPPCRPFPSGRLARAMGSAARPILATLAVGTGVHWGHAADVDLTKLPPAASGKVDFERDIQPILETSCLRCHGPERPKGGFRVDNQESAWKGGDSGPALVPGDSAQSRLIHFVARLDPEMAMPPDGKGDPLTSAQVGWLRAWIDQGANYPGDRQSSQPVATYSVTPVARWVSVDGDVRRFREDRWTDEEGDFGVSEFRWRQPVGSRDLLTVEGHALPGTDDYRISLRHEMPGRGWARAGFEQYRRYYDDSGGYAPEWARPLFELGRDLHMDIGKAWIEFGLKAPDYPEFVLGYEYHYREGDKSTLQWGEVTDPNTSPQRRIFPAAKHVDEISHVVKFDVRHEVSGVKFEDNFRGTFSNLESSRRNVLAYDLTQPGPEKTTLIKEGHDQFLGVNVVRLEKQVMSWLGLSAGYLYSKTDATASYNQSTDSSVGYNGPPDPFADRFWYSNQIVLDQQSHVFNANALVGPTGGFTVNAGVQSEWARQHGLGDVSLDEGDPDPAVGLLLQPATIDANHDRVHVEEHLGLRWTGIPWTVLYAEARLRQESRGQFEQEVISGAQDFLRDTDATMDGQEFRVGTSVSPWARVSMHLQVGRRESDSSYDHSLDELGAGLPGDGYSAFIRERGTSTDELTARLVWKTTSWAKTTFKYQYRESAWDTVTDPEPGFTGTPGGATDTADLRAHQYSVNLVLTPWRRWLVGGTLSVVDSELVTGPHDLPAVRPWSGMTYTTLANFTYLINPRTDVHGWYSWSRADYGDGDNGTGLPLGIVYDRHGLMAGVTRRLGDRATVSLDSGWFSLSEPSSGGFNDYDGFSVFVSASFRWP